MKKKFLEGNSHLRMNLNLDRRVKSPEYKTWELIVN